jgi:hypothetical protein
MSLYIQILMVACLTGMTSLLAHRSAAVFHDGIRPILPQLIEGHMNRREAGSIAFGLSIGFVASVGISFTLKTGLLNAWLLFYRRIFWVFWQSIACWHLALARCGAF